MCDKIDDGKKKWVIGGVIGGIILIVVIIVLAVTLSDSGDNDNKKGNNLNSGDGNDDDNTTTTDPTDSISSDTSVLFIIIDDLGWADIPRHDSLFSMPNLDSLYDEGIEFTNYYVHPVCTPTRASFLTGKYAWKLALHDIQTMPPGFDDRIPLNTPTVAEIFSKGLDYVTYYVGKWHLGYAKWEYTPVGRGFDYGFGILQSHGEYYEHTNSFADHPELTGYDMFDLTNKEPYWEGEGIYSTDLYFDKTKEYLLTHTNGGDNYGKPFYMYSSWQTIHEPMENPPINYTECQNIGIYPEVTIYCNKLKYFDYLLGELITFLKDNGLYDNTLLVVTTDNGGMPQYQTTFDSDFFFHSSYGCNYPYRGGKVTLFEGGVKGVGLMAGNIIEDQYKNTTSNILLHSVDWYNTLLQGIGGIDNITQFVIDNMPDFNGGDLSSTTFDGINIFDYMDDDIFDDNINRYYIYPNLEKENPLYNSTNETIDDLVNALSNGGITIDSLDINETIEEYIMSLNDIKQNFDVVIYNDIESKTVWKYIRGQHLYWNSYNCNQTWYNYDELLYIYNAEWLFNLTDNPYEYEEMNYLNPNFDFSSSDIDEYMVMNMSNHLRNQIDNEIATNGYWQSQDTRFYFKAIPQCNNMTWAPWLNGNDTFINNDCDGPHNNLTDLLNSLGYANVDELTRRYWD